jgi:tetratricopeptide (TPR) repeat protein
MVVVASRGVGAPVVTGMALQASPDSVSLVVPSAAPVRVFALHEPHRLVVDVPAISGLPNAPALQVWPVGRWGIDEVRTSQFSNDPHDPVTRIVVAMDRDTHWRVSEVTGGVRVSWAAPCHDRDEIVWGVLASIEERPPSTPAIVEATAPVDAAAVDAAHDTAPPHDAHAAPEPVAHGAPVPDVSAAPEPAAQGALVPDVRAAPEPVADRTSEPTPERDPPPIADPAPALDLKPIPEPGATSDPNPIVETSDSAAPIRTLPPEDPGALRPDSHGSPTSATPAPARDPARGSAPRTPGEERIWNRRAAELVAEARVHLAAGAYREGLDRLSRVFSYYPVSSHVASAHGLAARFACELHLGSEALVHLQALVVDPLASDSVLVATVETVSKCPLSAGDIDALRAIHGKMRTRFGSESRETRSLGVQLGKLLAETGSDLDTALALLAEGIKLYVDAHDAADVHRAVGLCQERRGAFGEAAEQQQFAARLLLPSDRAGALALRLRAADNLFRADSIDEALALYAPIASEPDAPADLRSWAAFQCGNCYYRQRNFELAMTAYQKLSADYPSSFWSQQAQARIAVLDRSRSTR